MILKRLLLYPLLIIFVLIYLLLAIVYIPGVPGLALKLGKSFIPEAIDIGSISGSLSGELILRDIRYEQGETQVLLGNAYLNWKPSCLLRSRLCIDRIELNQLSLQLPVTEQESEPRTEPFTLPELTDIQLPISVDLNIFQLNSIEVLIGEQQFNLDKVELSASFNDELTIDSLQIVQGDTLLEWVANLHPIDDYDLMSDLRWNIEVSDIEDIINQNLELPIHSPVSGNLILSGNAKRFDLSLENRLSTDISGPVSVKLASEIAPYEEQLQLKNLTIKLTESLAQINVSGDIQNWLEPRLDFVLNWQHLEYPIMDNEHPKMVKVPQGNIIFEGLLTDYQVSLDTAISGQDIPDVSINVEGAGDLEALQQFKLHAALLGGQVDVEGKASWAEQIAWDTRVWIRHLNPGQFNPELEGNINLELKTRGQLKDSGPDVFAELVSLNGQFRELPLRGQGQVHYATDAINIDTLLLGLGTTQMDLNGNLRNEQLAMNFNLTAPDLASLLPDLAGQLSASGQINGPMLTPNIQAELAGTEIRFQENEIEQLKGQIKADLSGSQSSNIDLSLDNMTVAGQLLETLSINLKGKPENHQLKLLTTGELLNLTTQVNGRFDQAQMTYQGQLSGLDIERTEIGRWQQNGVSDFSVDAPAFSLSQTCLLQVEGDASLCMAANRNASDRVTADFNLSELSLRLLDPFLQGNQIDSALNISGQFSQQGTQKPSADINLSTTAGKLLTPEEQPDFNLDPIEMTANLNNDRLNATIASLFSEMDGQLLANIDIQELSGQQRVQGDLDISLNDLAMISAFVPTVQAIEGQLQGQFLISGSLSAPVVRGSFDLKDGAADLPAQGISLAPLEISIQADGDAGEAMALQGLIGSGDGEIRVDGNLNLASMEGELTIKGEDFEAMATEINLHISPDISILVDNAIRVGGSVTVPFAHIKPPRQQAQSAVQASGDVVFADLDEEGLTENNLPLLTDLELILGDSVRVDAFGFKGRLLGRLRIQDDGVSATRASGSVQVESGDYRLFGQNMTIQRGRLIFSGGPVDNPGLDLRVSRTIDTVEAGARIVGTLLTPEFTLFSTPAMPDSSIMSYLVLGRGPGDSSTSEQSMMLQAAMALTMQGGNTVTGQLREELSLDELGFASDDSGSSAFFIGKYLTPRLYIRYGVSLLESVDVLTLSYRLSSMWKVETQSSSVGSGADFFYTRER